MPRKTTAGRSGMASMRYGFNEAAARCRGKLDGAPGDEPARSRLQ